ncbi:MAG: peptidoglycan bridge formation glycyltransferase FemA/FemB family protein [Chloroflexi bacterium]|nr:peptidoglycan bridge formation glycyltransferase FemA/FemB family protein [Chloroflexota bacterium]
MPEVNAAGWEEYLRQHPEAHLLQSAAWGELKSGFGWSAARLVDSAGRCGAQVLFRRLLPGVTLGYLPKGPVGVPDEAFLSELEATCRRRGAAVMVIEPDAWEAEDKGAAATLLANAGFSPGHATIQPRRTLTVSLEGDEEALLMRMKQKTRYNIRLAIKKGVTVRACDDLNLFYDLMQTTGARDQFGVHSREYYQWAYELFMPGGHGELLLAEYQSTPLAALMVFARGERAWYFYGASSDAQRELMAPYLLQWEAMRWARSRGCRVYDLWGVPDADLEMLEGSFAARSDGLWGVYRFKRGFGGELRRAAAAWERIYRPVWGRIYRWQRGRRAASG